MYILVLKPAFNHVLDQLCNLLTAGSGGGANGVQTPFCNTPFIASASIQGPDPAFIPSGLNLNSGKTKCSGMDVNRNPAMIDVFELIPDGVQTGGSFRLASSLAEPRAGLHLNANNQESCE
jgi:hypothetical protein